MEAVVLFRDRLAIEILQSKINDDKDVRKLQNFLFKNSDLLNSYNFSLYTNKGGFYFG